MVFKIEKNKNYTIMSNYHLRDKNLSFKAKGLLSFMLSLPEDWDYSLNGLVAVSKESKKAIRGIINELREHGYLVTEQARGEKGYYKYNYIIYEEPHIVEVEKNNPDTQKGYADEGNTEKDTQINTKEINTKEQIDKIDKTINGDEEQNSSSFSLDGHHAITKDLVIRKYLEKDDTELYKYDKFFREILKEQDYVNVISITHYIISRVVNRHFYDEYDNKIENKYGYLTKSIENNIEMFKNNEIVWDEEFDLNKVVRLVTDFTSEDLSNWYIRRNRKRFQSSDLDNSKKGVYQTTYQVLVGLSQLVAPIIPFISEEIYQNLTDEESVHLSDFPKYEEDKIDDYLEVKMDLVRDLISLGRNVREVSKIKVRQPISDVILDGKNKELLNDVIDLIKEELNVKNIIFTNDLSNYMNFTIKPNFKNAGSVIGSKMKDFVNFLANLSSEDITKLKNNEEMYFEDILITNDLIDIKINAKEGFDVAMENNNFIILNTTLTDDLINEGLARETISKIQQIRKSNNFDIVDRIKVYYEANDEYTNRINDYLDMIKDETLAIEFNKENNLTDEYDINDYKVKFKLERL